MKNIFLIFLFSWNLLLAQDTKTFDLTIDYSPNFSQLSNELVDESPKFSHNSFIKVEFPISNAYSLNLGMGFMNFGTLVKSDIGGGNEIERIKIVSNYHYVNIPVGIKFRFNKFFVNPESSIGILVHEKEKFITYFTDGDKNTEKRDGNFGNGSLNKLPISLILSAGREFKINNMDLILGLRGYYSVSQLVLDVPRKNRFMGIGLLVGIKI